MAVLGGNRARLGTFVIPDLKPNPGRVGSGGEVRTLGSVGHVRKSGEGLRKSERSARSNIGEALPERWTGQTGRQEMS